MHPKKAYPVVKEHGDKNRPEIPKSGDHRGWAVYWGEATLRCIQRLENRAPYSNPELERLDLEHVKRCARLAWYHVCRLKGYKYWDVGYSGEPK